jgi:FG-GAP-like repeat
MPSKNLYSPARITSALIVALVAFSCSSANAEPAVVNKLTANIKEAEIFGYLNFQNNGSPASYNSGYSMYVAVWPFLNKYPGNRFNTGLPSTWMWSQYPEGNPVGLGDPSILYSDIEGGLGWWEDTRFATETPKFIMGGVALNFSEWANGPGSGKGRDWNTPNGKYGVAQLSPWLLFPPDGLNLKQGTNGGLFGYGYLPLPLTKPKTTTAGSPVPTGNHSWTLFLNAGNFKGPVAFFTPYFWSRASIARPDFSGTFLDSRFSSPNRALQGESHYIPSYTSTDSKGESYARIAPISFPRDANGNSVIVHGVTVYDQSALWAPVNTWFDGGAAAGTASGVINLVGSAPQTFSSGQLANQWKSTWAINKIPIAWDSFATSVALDNKTFAYSWNEQLVSNTGSNFLLPQYFRSVKNAAGVQQWAAVQPKDVPIETGLATLEFNRAPITAVAPYVTPTDALTTWKKPGPVAGPFKAHLGDGSMVTYYWYRFVDQPALLNADLTDSEREAMQLRAEKLHKAWTKERQYLPAPTVGTLADVDPALVVTPPKGFEVGYVPIITWQGADDGRSNLLVQSSTGTTSAWLMNGTTISSSTNLLSNDPNWSVSHIADFNGDGTADILWRNTNGAVTLWLMNGTTVTSAVGLLGADPNWRVSHVGDFNGDGKADLLWRHANGAVTLWLMNGTAISSATGILGADANWSISHVADFNGDGKADLLWRNTNGAVTTWLMNGSTISSAAGILGADANWRVSHVADFNSDGKADLLWRNINGAVTIWLMNGTAINSAAGILGADANWRVSHTGDFNGDGKADLLWRNTNGAATIWLMNGIATTGTAGILGADANWRVSHIADLNGDGKSDLVWRNLDGSITTWLMNGTVVSATAGLIGAGTLRVMP